MSIFASSWPVGVPTSVPKRGPRIIIRQPTPTKRTNKNGPRSLKISARFVIPGGLSKPSGASRANWWSLKRIELYCPQAHGSELISSVIPAGTHLARLRALITLTWLRTMKSGYERTSLNSAPALAE